MCPIINIINYINRELDQRAGTRGVDVVDWLFLQGGFRIVSLGFSRKQAISKRHCPE